MFGESVELVRLREGAENDEDLLPFREVGVLDDVGEVVGDDGLEESKVGEGGGSSFEVGLLGSSKKIGSSSNGEKDGIRESIRRETKRYG